MYHICGDIEILRVCGINLTLIVLLNKSDPVVLFLSLYSERDANHRLCTLYAPEHVRHPALVSTPHRLCPPVAKQRRPSPEAGFNVSHNSYPWCVRKRFRVTLTSNAVGKKHPALQLVAEHWKERMFMIKSTHNTAAEKKLERRVGLQLRD